MVPGFVSVCRVEYIALLLLLSRRLPVPAGRHKTLVGPCLVCNSTQSTRLGRRPPLGSQNDHQQSSRKCIPFTTTNCNNVVPERSGSGKSLWVFRFRTVPAAHTRLTYRKHQWSDSTSPHLVYMMEKLAILRCAPLTYYDRNLSR